MALHRRRMVGAPPPKVTIVGKNEVYHWGYHVGLFLVQTVGSQTPHPPF